MVEAVLEIREKSCKFCKGFRFQGYTEIQSKGEQKLTKAETQPSSNPVKITDKALNRSFGISELVLRRKRLLQCHLKAELIETNN